MLKAWWDLYRTAGAFARACPLLFLVPCVPELAQHIVEYRIGLFASLAAAKTAEHDTLRMLFGSIKLLGLLLPGYWVVRFAMWRDPQRAAAWDGPAIRAYIPVFLYGAVASLATIWGGQALGKVGGAVMAVGALLVTIFDILFAQWRARAPIADPCAGPLRSIRAIGPDFPWAAAFFLFATLPPMAIHYVLNYLAIGKPMALSAALLALDALFVGYLIAVISCAPVFIARHAEARAERRPA